MSIGDMKLQDWLRYGLSGAVGLMGLASTQPRLLLLLLDPAKSQQQQQLSPVPLQFSAGTITLLLALAFIIGVLIYTLHRAVIYPIAYWLVLLFLAPWRYSTDFKRDLLIPYRPSRTETDLCEWHWRSLAKERFWASRFAEWAAQIHFLFCCAWAAGLAVLLGCLLGRPNMKGVNFLCGLAIVVVIAALVSALRLTYVMKHARNNWQDNDEKARFE